jgi:hypothetical protein
VVIALVLVGVVAGGKTTKCRHPRPRERSDAVDLLKRHGVDWLERQQTDGAELWLCYVSTDPDSGSGAAYLVVANDSGSWDGFELHRPEGGLPRDASGRVDLIDYLN